MGFLFLNINAETFNITKNFTNSEIISASHPQEGEETFMIDEKVVLIAQYIREQLNVPVKVNSAFRNEKYNSELRGSASNSQHIYGKALDLSAKGIVAFLEEAYDTNNEHGKKLYEMGLRGIGFYDWGVHIDTREQKGVSKWDYRKKKALVKSLWSIVVLIIIIWITQKRSSLAA